MSQFRRLLCQLSEDEVQTFVRPPPHSTHRPSPKLVGQFRRLPLAMRFNYEELVPKLRQAGMAASGLQLFVLFMESGSVGVTGVCFQFVLLLAEFGIFAFNFYNHVDGRKEVHKAARAQEPQEKAQHAALVGGAFVLAVLLHLCAADLSSGLSTFLFTTADYVAMGVGFANFCIDVIEGANGLTKTHEA
ncbi:hypothetical protein L596_006920 [Steinernema carpocapsae]|uniref:DUF7087 domain-containing protein n=1 Tax=Steinernema carpocapsae TaxID=34508 RepID=A0A4U5P7E4_STECR|nr:hypothetical protein L596_006920 [Steinernema carpocapsae]